MAVVVVDGIIGAGKTFFINALIHTLKEGGINATFITEPVDIWEKNGRLKDFYENPSRRAYQFQTRVLLDRIKGIKKGVSENNCDVYILERSIYTDLVFMKNLFDDNIVDTSEYEDYLELWEEWEKHMPITPSLFIYLEVDIDIAMKRIKKRKRNGEGTISKKYLEGLKKSYEFFIGNTVNTGKSVVKVNRVDANIDFSIPEYTSNIKYCMGLCTDSERKLKINFL